MAQAIQTVHAQRFVDVNDAFLEMTGFTRDQIVGRTPVELRLCLDYKNGVLQSVREGRGVRNTEAQFSTRGGELRTALVSLEPLSLAGEPHILLMAQDVTDRIQLENQLRQAQKMEAIGQLAAGIAHDFNNLLTIIQGHASLHLGTDDYPRQLAFSLQQINTASERAADLTRKLLTFSRRGMIRPRVLNANDSVQSVAKMLHRLLGEKVTLQTELGPALPSVFADVTGLEQVLMNLAVNARDAMPDGGTIAIRTSAITLNGDAQARHPEARAGEFVCLSVADTGKGMDETVRARIFEPFFTTKGLNNGTGMGLATVYGIVKQHEGWVEVETAIGKGSVFSVFLPSTDREPEQDEHASFTPVPDSGRHTILVVEDDAAVRSLVVEILQSFNYRVIEAETGDDAIAGWPRWRDEVDLLLTDMVMPGDANGLDVARHCLSENPNLKVIYSSGYSSELFDSNVQLEEGVNYLPKPYLSGKLTAVIRKALQQPGGTPAVEPVA
jgi:PAS domain S-box-containing protein